MRLLYATVYTRNHDMPPPLTAPAAAVGLRAMGATARRRRSSLAIGLSLSIQSR